MDYVGGDREELGMILSFLVLIIGRTDRGFVYGVMGDGRGGGYWGFVSFLLLLK